MKEGGEEGEGEEDRKISNNDDNLNTVKEKEKGGKGGGVLRTFMYFSAISDEMLPTKNSRFF